MNGFLHLNVANQWPSFAFTAQDFAIDAAGALRLAASGSGFVTRGLALAGPFEVPGVTAWFRLQAAAAPLPTGTHLQFHTYTSGGVPPPFEPLSDDPFPGAAWIAAPRDELDALILNRAARLLWIGVTARSEGDATPALDQIRIEYGRETYLQHLPAIYGEEERARDLIERILALDASVLGGIESEIVGLTRRFDPYSAPAGDFPSGLAWLASWLDFDLNERWTEPETREYLAEAFRLYARRGTIDGLRRYLKIYAGVEACITEPARHAALWSLGESSTLGFTTRLAPGPLGGAVLDSTAHLDRSHLNLEELPGAALFDDLAHRFCVHIYCSDLSRAGALADARAVRDREKPAHTVYDLCVIEPRMRVGAQAILGVDTIIGQAPPAQIGMELDRGVLLESAQPCEKEGFPNGTDRRCR